MEPRPVVNGVIESEIKRLVKLWKSGFDLLIQIEIKIRRVNFVKFRIKMGGKYLSASSNPRFCKTVIFF